MTAVTAPRAALLDDGPRAVNKRVMSMFRDVELRASSPTHFGNRGINAQLATVIKIVHCYSVESGTGPMNVILSRG